MRKRFALVILTLAGALFLAGCDLRPAEPTPTIVPLAARAVEPDTPTPRPPTPTRTPAPTPTVRPTRTPTPAPTPTPTRTPAPPKGWVTSLGLNVRTGPGTDYPAIGALEVGDVVEVVGRSGGWYQIAYPEAEGGRAWVSAAFVDVLGDVASVPRAEAGPPPPPTPTPPLPYTGKLVFQTANGGDVYVVNVDGSGLRKLTTGMDPALSPDGSQVAFVRWGGQQPGVYVLDADGRGERRVFGGPEFKAPAWSPDGKRLVFSMHGGSQRREDCWAFYGKQFCLYYGDTDFWKLGMVEVDSGQFTELWCDETSRAPTWSPDGWWIAYDGVAGLQLTSPRNEVTSVRTQDARDMTPAWSPDNERLAITYQQHDHAEVYVVDPWGTERLRLTASSPAADRPANNAAPAWSPDSRWIAFFSDRRGQGELWVMRADGSDQRPMFPGGLPGVEFGPYDFAHERIVSWGP